MTRLFGLLGLVLPLAASAGEGAAPERLVPRTSALYFRWDGYTPHKAAYDASAAGAMLRDRYGDWLAEFGAFVEKAALDKLLGENPILQGRPPSDVVRREKMRQQFLALKGVFRDHGLLVCADVKTNALMGLLSKQFGVPDGFGYEARLVVPGASRHRELFEAVAAALISSANPKLARLEPTVADVGGRRVSSWVTPAGPLQLWVEGADLVMRFGTAPVESVLADLDRDCEGIAGTARYRRLMAEAQFTVTTRLMVDPSFYVRLLNSVGDVKPQESVVLNLLRGLKGVDYAGGFDGKLSRYHLDFGGTDSATNLANVFEPRPIRLDELPPLPLRCSRWAAARLDPAKFEAWAMGIFGEPDDTRAAVKDLLKFDVRRDLVPHLGDTLVCCVDEDEGKVMGFNIGHTFLWKVRDEAAARKAVRELAGSIGTAFKTGNAFTSDRGRQVMTVKATKEISPFGIGANFAVHKGWLVVSASANAVRSTLDRLDGVNPAWTPDEASRKRLEMGGPDAFGMQWSDPTQTLRRAGDMAAFLFQITVENGGNSKGVDYGPLLALPTSASVERHLFPNVTHFRKAGGSVRFDARDSFSLPLEAANFETLFGLGLLFR